MFELLVTIHATLLTAGRRFHDEEGQTSAEYALVLLGAASVALLVALWARKTDRIGKLLDTVFDSVTKLVK